ncbi:MAG: hypothetical protein ACRD1G_14720 [Acidimicrobiales bacterium]
MTLREQTEAISIPSLSWKAVQARVDRLWQPEYAPHHSIFSQNGGGKSHLIVYGLLPLCLRDNVAIFDSKGDDPVLSASGAKPVRSVPSKLRRTLDNDRDRDGWLRLVIHDEVSRAQDQVGSALERIYDEGNWIVVLDETRAISDPRSPGLGLQPLLDRLWLRGRSRRICVIAATQAPRWVPASFYDQCQFCWAGRIRDQRAHQRIMEIGSMTRAHIPHIARIRKRRFLYMDDEEEDTWLAETGL